MKVKKTKAGKFVVELAWSDADTLINLLVSFLEAESAAIRFIKLNEADHFKRHEHYYAVNHFLLKHYARLAHPLLYSRLNMKPLEAFTLLHFLWDHELSMGLKDVRSQLHQLLS
jgi:hypothetical protein